MIHTIYDHQVIIDDAITGMRELPSGSVNCILTSPPYFGLRKYFDDGRPELGTENDPYLYAVNLIEILDECKRVLRDDGTLWLNIGDSWAGSGKGPMGKNGVRKLTNVNYPKESAALTPPGFKAKDMFGVPHIVANALRLSGWYLRQEIIWMKPNPVPFSGDDRCTNQIEYIFMFSKQKRYFYDNFAVRQKGSEIIYHGSHEQGVQTSNLKNVWVIPTGSHGTHTATFPKELVRRVISLATPNILCGGCGGSIERSIIRHSSRTNQQEAERRVSATGGAISGGTRLSTLGVTNFTTFDLNGYQSCKKCGWIVSDDQAESLSSKAVVLDPFVGSGTTIEVAHELGRRAIGIDLDPRSIEYTRERLKVAS